MAAKKILLACISLGALACNTNRVLNLPPLDTYLDSEPPAISSSANATFTFHGSSRAVSFQCTLDNGTVAACTSPATYSGLANGQHTFAVAAVAGDGTVDPTPAQDSWTIDTDVPDTQIDFHPDALSTSASAAFLFEATIVNCTFNCALDGADAGPCTSPTTYSGLTDGPHTFSVAATDPAGVTDPTPATFSWNIDTTPPDTTIESGPASTIETNTATFTFVASKPDCTFTCTLDGTQAACTSPYTVSSLAAGQHSFLVAAIDSFGLQDPTPAQAFFTVQAAQLLQTTLTSSPSPLSNNSSASFAFTANNPNATFVCSIDGAAATSCTSPATYLGLADGAHTFEVIASVGGVAELTPPSYSWTIDTIAPVTVLLTHPNALTNVNTATFTFTTNPVESPVSFSCRLDTNAATLCTSPYTTGTLADGSHTFTVAATDEAGNTDHNPPNYTWTVDTTPPDTQLIITPAPLSYFNDAQFVVASTDSSGTFLCGLDTTTLSACPVLNSGVHLGQAYIYTDQYTGVADGSHTFYAAAVDLAGNIDPTPASYTWTAHNPWIIAAQLPAFSLGNWTSVDSIGSKIYIAGGSGSQYSTPFWSFDTAYVPAADAGVGAGFTQLTSLPFCDGCGQTSQLTASGGIIYSFGSPQEVQDGGSIYFVGDSYNPATDEWGSPSYPLLSDGGIDDLGETGQTAWNGEIYYVGGRTDNAAVNIYTTATNSWRAGPEFPYGASFNFSLVADNNRIYAFGNQNGDGELRPAVLDPTVDGGTWQLLTVQPGIYPAGDARQTSEALLYGSTIYLAGEVTSSSNYDHDGYVGLLAYNPTNDTWNMDAIAYPDAGTVGGDMSPVVTSQGIFLVANSQVGNNVELTIWKYVPVP